MVTSFLSYLYHIGFESTNHKWPHMWNSHVNLFHSTVKFWIEGTFYCPKNSKKCSNLVPWNQAKDKTYSMGVIWNPDMGGLITDQGESSTCSVHALSKAVRQSLAEQSLNIHLNNCLASFLQDPNVDEEEGNFQTKSMEPKSQVWARKGSSGLANLNLLKLPIRAFEAKSISFCTETNRLIVAVHPTNSLVACLPENGDIFKS